MNRNSTRSVRLSLFTRIYLFAILVAALAVAIPVVTVIVYVGSERETKNVARWLALTTYELRDNAELLEGPLINLQSLHGLTVGLFDRDDNLLVSTRGASHTPLSLAERTRIAGETTFRRDNEGGVVSTIAVDDRIVAYAIVTDHSTIDSTPLLLYVLCSLLGLALLAWPAAWSIAAPVRRLTTAVSRFGAGDLSARVESKRRDELGQLARAFDRMADRTHALLRTERLLVANISHELRTPLARLRLALELIEDDGELQQPDLAAITEDLQELEDIVDDVMRISRLTAGKESAATASATPKKPTDFAQFLRATVQRWSRQYPSRALHISVPELPAVDMDARLMSRCVINLLQNADRYSDPHLPILITAWACDRHVLFTVEDRGTGIEAAAIEQVFDPFFRTDQSRSRATGGVGLGLAITKSTVEAHQGTISVTSKVGHGSIFRVRLPQARQPSELQQSET